ncbi:ankyrin repeat-containing protein NPR4 isoform X1 [Beta vulgaris subsp. vulgaris]|uniref:ankyrin repeat-containing protein NPR4 isoform X1 n=2 Tax=Beta vulgaris subsp. vulgaris TaxID=3555 RepID=UPI0025489BB5|nr:ankyrin repeat-containing protein NPR4 isoform X1 [Beta vulgaris subsp. vulgaris]XP_057248733.1 ankyrin repeat-containing protein NPR4 isoform X1 [Beta vulgaris subsp. vulgaris]
MGGVISSLSKSNGKTDNKGKSVSQRTRWRMDNKFKELGGYLPLYKAALGGQWKVARKFIADDPKSLIAKITIASETALHIAVSTGKNLDFVEKLVRRMSPEELALTDQNGETALSMAAIVGNTEAAELLVSKNPDLPNIASKSGFPLHWAAQYGQKPMLLYLLDITRKDMDPSPFSGESGVKLLISIITAEFYDIALKLVNLYPDLATMELNGLGSPLSVLAEKPNAFPSGCHWKFWPQVLNPCVFCMFLITKDISIAVSYLKYVRDTKLMHHQAILLVKCLCLEIMELDDAKAFSMLQEPLHLAAKLGIDEFIEEIVGAFPPAIWSVNEENHNVFQLAVTYRRENVFNLIYQMSEYRHLVTRYIDPHGNNILHLAGRLPPPDRLNLVSGAALQMQRELQWFKEVEKFVQPAYKAWKNAKGKTPSFVFSEAHQNLVKEGEKWMKDTATSCTVAAALIATVVFAAAITVPGGNDQNSGTPLYVMPEQHQQRAFAVFGVFDAISLFSSVTSILMFLSILTSRYAEADFLYALPKRLIIGLSMLLISITSLMVAFSSALYLVLGQNKPWRLLLVGALASLPVTLFIFLQFPLLLEIMLATYGRGIFQKKGNRMLH